MMTTRARVLTALVITCACAGFSALWGQQALQRPKLVVMISIDQMRFDYLTRFPRLYKGGLRTLLDRGAIFSHANYRHASSETGPGHSVLLSGRHLSLIHI